MINHLHAILHRPGSGWDPVPLAHAEHYSSNKWERIDVELIDRLEDRIDGFEGKRILDLGGGPGQFSIAFAQRGAEVVWHDISNNFRNISEQKAKQANVEVRYSIGYLEDAKKFATTPFDLVFNRICWRYCKSDAAFADVIFSVMKPGGAAYIDSPLERIEKLSAPRRAQVFLDHNLNLKIGHSNPPRGRIAKLFLKQPIERMVVDYSSPVNDRIFVVKAR